jgi:hypothetical protein
VEAEEFSSNGLAVNDFGNPLEQRSSSLAYALGLVNAVSRFPMLRLGMAGRRRQILVRLDSL